MVGKCLGEIFKLERILGDEYFEIVGFGDDNVLYGKIDDIFGEVVIGKLGKGLGNTMDVFGDAVACFSDGFGNRKDGETTRLGIGLLFGETLTLGETFGDGNKENLCENLGLLSFVDIGLIFTDDIGGIIEAGDLLGSTVLVGKMEEDCFGEDELETSELTTGKTLGLDEILANRDT